MVYVPESASSESAPAMPSGDGVRREHHRFRDLFHLWIPKFVAQSVSLLLPHHKIRWTPHHTKAFERVVRRDDGQKSQNHDHNAAADGDGIGIGTLTENDCIRSMVEEHLEIERQSLSATALREQSEQRIADRILDELQRSTDHQGFVQSLQTMSALFGRWRFVERWCSAPKLYLILERYTLCVLQ